MAQEKTPWFLANDNDEPEADDASPGRFNADELEFESFMFDQGQGLGRQQSGPLGQPAMGTAVAQPPAQPATSPFSGGEVARRDNSPLPRSSGPLPGKSGPLLRSSSSPLLRDSGPLPLQNATRLTPDAIPDARLPAEPAQSQADAARPIMPTSPTSTGGLQPVSQSAPLRASGPLVDGRTSTGPFSTTPTTTTPGLNRTPTDPHGLATHPAAPAARHATNPFVTGGIQHRPSSRPVTSAAQTAPTPSTPLITPTSGPLAGPAGRGTDPLKSEGLPQPAASSSAAHSEQPAGGLMSRMSEDEPASTQSEVPAPDDATFGSWTDSALASVEDFSAILFSLQEGTAHEANGAMSHSPGLATGGWATTDSSLSHGTGSTDAFEVEPASDLSAPEEFAPETEDALMSRLEAPSTTPPQVRPLAEATGSPESEPQQEGRFQGDHLEFESFMFDPGDAPTQNGAQSKRTSGPLPFWLRNTGDLEAPPVTEYMDMIGVAPTNTGAQDNVAAEPEGSAAESYEEFYADLPAIEPFDYSAIALPENEFDQETERLGFSAGELSGFQMPERGLMTATTDLAVVADMIGEDPGEAGEEVSLAESALSQDYDPAGSDAPVQSIATELPDAAEHDEFDEQSEASGWTAMVTSNLPTGAATDEQTAAIGMEQAQEVGEAGSEGAPGLDDLDVDPFDYDQLNLDSDDTITGPLGFPTRRITGPLGASSTRTLISGPLSPKSLAHEGETTEVASNGRRWPTGWLGEGEEEGGETGQVEKGPRSAHTQARDQKKRRVKRRNRTTGTSLESFLDERVVPLDMEAGAVGSQAHDTEALTESLAGGLTEALTESLAETHALLEETEQAQEPQAQAEPSWTYPATTRSEEAPESYALPQAVEVAMDGTQKSEGTGLEDASVSGAETGSEIAQVQPARSEKTGVSFPTALLNSGPLPELEGFDHIQQIVANNPDDLGAHMALAAAYAQMGDVVTELRVYRRVLRKPTLSSKLLSLIAEELNDCEDEMGGHPQFHQVRGDLYMRQGRFQEAIAEYNKLA